MVKIVRMENYRYISQNGLLNKTAGKKVILIDFFDTLVFRRIHSSQVYVPWAKALKTRLDLGNVTVESLINLRQQSNSQLCKKYAEPSYSLIMGLLWESIDCNISKDDFVNQSLEVDIDIELGCQYGNTHLIGFLKRAKARGQKIYVVSDFYLPASAYAHFLVNADCNDVIDGVFVSEGCNKTKANGDLYPYVLEQIGVQAKECVMIGDSRHSDVRQAIKNGILGLWYFPLKHKIWTNICRIFNMDYSKSILSKQARHLFCHTLYDEYAIVLFAFAQKLISTAQEDAVGKLVFFSRGGDIC